MTITSVKAQIVHFQVEGFAYNMFLWCMSTKMLPTNGRDKKMKNKIRFNFMGPIIVVL